MLIAPSALVDPALSTRRGARDHHLHPLASHRATDDSHAMVTGVSDPLPKRKIQVFSQLTTLDKIWATSSMVSPPFL
jgi:hypothetical protein